jgi:hypothetical protein
MTSRTTSRLLLALIVAGCAVPAMAADQIRDQDIYGSQLMNAQERNDYRSRMRTATTAEERERIRNEHHTQMKIRAKERGVTLPDEPPANRGPGMGPGGGMGGGRR